MTTSEALPPPGVRVNDYWSGLLSTLRGDHRQPTEDQQRLAECFSSGLSSTGNLMPFSYAPRAPLPIYNHQSSTGEVYALKEAGRALLAELDARENSTVAWRTRDDDAVERFRALVEHH